MPTTLTLDDDLAGLLRAEAERKAKPMPEIAMMLLRKALAKPAANAFKCAAPFRIQPQRGVFAPGVNLKKLNRMADELDTAAILAKQGQRS